MDGMLTGLLLVMITSMVAIAFAEGWISISGIIVCVLILIQLLAIAVLLPRWLKKDRTK